MRSDVLAASNVRNVNNSSLSKTRAPPSPHRALAITVPITQHKERERERERSRLPNSGSSGRTRKIAKYSAVMMSLTQAVPRAHCLPLRGRAHTIDWRGRVLRSPRADVAYSRPLDYPRTPVLQFLPVGAYTRDVDRWLFWIAPPTLSTLTPPWTRLYALSVVTPPSQPISRFELIALMSRIFSSCIKLAVPPNRPNSPLNTSSHAPPLDHFPLRCVARSTWRSARPARIPACLICRNFCFSANDDKIWSECD